MGVTMNVKILLAVVLSFALLAGCVGSERGNDDSTGGGNANTPPKTENLDAKVAEKHIGVLMVNYGEPVEYNATTYYEFRAFMEYLI
jgi:hypothetical protein